MITSTITAVTRILTHRTRSAVFFSIRCSASAEFAGGEYDCGPPNGEGAPMSVRSRRVPKALRVPAEGGVSQGMIQSGEPSSDPRPRPELPP